MLFSIAERLKPFSHIPGVKLLIPGTDVSIQIFPALLVINNQKIPLKIHGPVHNFTVQQDLEKSCIRVFGENAEGYFRYTLQARDGRVDSTIEKQLKEPFCLPLDVHSVKIMPLIFGERLSLGNHKAQDIEMILRRQDLMEILPLWLRLGQLTPQVFSHEEGTAALLNRCQLAIKANSPEKIGETFLNLYNAGFEGLLFPRLKDASYLGIIPDVDSIDSSLSPLYILHAGASLIRSLFIQQEGNKITILPALPPKLHCGRFLHIHCNETGVLKMEWSKKQIRRMQFAASIKGDVEFLFPKDIKTYRLRRKEGDQGIICTSGVPLTVEPGVHLLFDNFKK